MLSKWYTNGFSDMYITVVDKNLNPCIYIPESDDHSYNKSDKGTGKKTKYKKPKKMLKNNNNIEVDRTDVSRESNSLTDREICVDDSYKPSLICDNTNTIIEDVSKQKLELLDESKHKQNKSDKDVFKNNQWLCIS